MISLAEARQTLGAYTVSGCGLTHHYTWTHGRELPQCPQAVREGRLDCAHSKHTGLHEALGVLVAQPSVPFDFVQCVRQAIAVGHDALWLADLLAIELSNLSQNHLAGRMLPRPELRAAREVEALRGDGSIDHSRCEAAIRNAQSLGSTLMLAVRDALITALDTVATYNSSEQLEQVLAASQEHLARVAHEVETACFSSSREE